MFSTLVLASILLGDVSKASPSETAAFPLKSFSISATSFASGISALSGLSVGMNIPEVRFEDLK